jgi:transketolase
MESFGASAPAGALYKHFGFTAERVAEIGRAVANRVKGGN